MESCPRIGRGGWPLLTGPSRRAATFRGVNIKDAQRLWQLGRPPRRPARGRNPREAALTLPLGPKGVRTGGPRHTGGSPGRGARAHALAVRFPRLGRDPLRPSPDAVPIGKRSHFRPARRNLNNAATAPSLTLRARSVASPNGASRDESCAPGGGRCPRSHLSRPLGTRLGLLLGPWPPRRGEPPSARRVHSGIGFPTHCGGRVVGPAPAATRCVVVCGWAIGAATAAYVSVVGVRRACGTLGPWHPIAVEQSKGHSRTVRACAMARPRCPSLALGVARRGPSLVLLPPRPLSPAPTTSAAGPAPLSRVRIWFFVRGSRAVYATGCLLGGSRGAGMAGTRNIVRRYAAGRRRSVKAASGAPARGTGYQGM